MKKILQKITAVALVLTLFRCEIEVPERAEKLTFISSIKNETLARYHDGCVFKFIVIDKFINQNDDAQNKAIADAFSTWENGNPNLLFISTKVSEQANIYIQLVEPSQLIKGDTLASIGFVRGNISSISSSKFEKSKFFILLDNSANWKTENITKAIAYHIGLFLGMKTSNESSSIMFQNLINNNFVLNPRDTETIRKLYPVICKENNYEDIPNKFKVGNTIVKKIKFKANTSKIFVSAKGVVYYGPYINTTPPKGKHEVIIFGFPFPFKIEQQFYLDTDHPHGALLYRFSDVTKWSYCGESCQIPTNNNRTLEIIFEVNDNPIYKADNTGAFDISIDYQ